MEFDGGGIFTLIELQKKHPLDRGRATTQEKDLPAAEADTYRVRILLHAGICFL